VGAYYKHTKTETVKVTYSFRCEHCMEDSGPQQAVISGMQAEINSNYKTLDEKKQDKLAEMAHKNLVSAVKEAYVNATEKHTYIKAFKDECPHCHKPQTWSLTGMKDDMFSTPIVCVILGIIIGAGCYFFSGVENNLMIALAAAGICIVIGAGILVLNLIKIGNKTKQTAGVLQKNEPAIEWDDVQHILNEG
jgi:hypothetical protein